MRTGGVEGRVEEGKTVEGDGSVCVFVTHRYAPEMAMITSQA